METVQLVVNLSTQHKTSGIGKFQTIKYVTYSRIQVTFTSNIIIKYGMKIWYESETEKDVFIAI